jgi:hypothetical protein
VIYALLALFLFMILNPVVTRIVLHDDRIEFQRIVVSGHLADTPSVSLSPGQSLRGAAEQSAVTFAAGIDGLGLDTPMDVVGGLNKETNIAIADSKVVARFADLNGSPMPMTPPDYGKLIADETDKSGEVIRVAHIKAE